VVKSAARLQAHKGVTGADALIGHVAPRHKVLHGLAQMGHAVGVERLHLLPRRGGVAVLGRGDKSGLVVHTK